MLHRDIDSLEPKFLEKIKAFISILDEKKISYYIVETKRDLDVQEAYYAQGREPLPQVNNLRKKAGLYLLSSEKENVKITWTMNSKHLLGLAIDITPSKGGPINKPWWGAPDGYWKEIADIGVWVGLESGYYWDTKDAPHVEYKGEL